MSEENNNQISGSSNGKSGTDWTKFILPGAIILAGVLISASIIYSNGGFDKLTAGGTDGIGGSANIGSGLEDRKNISADDDPFLGNPKAKVTIIEFSDFQCPFCGRFFQTVEPQIIKNYVETGKAKFVYRDYAFLGPESNWAAQAADCANEQNKFWEYHDYLFNHQDGENQGAFSMANLKGFAKTLGLNAGTFNKCLDSDKYASEVAGDVADGQKAGVNGTPTVFINGRSVVGAQPFDAFKTIIEEELNK